MSLLRGCGRCGRRPPVVLEELDVAAVAEPVEADLADHGARVHAEVHGHPVVVRLLGAQRVDRLGAEHVDEEALGLVEIGHGEADVVGAAHSGDSLRHARPPCR